MVRMAARVFALFVVVVTACALVAGCAGNSSDFPYLSRSKSAGEGFSSDFDPSARRIELRPEVCTARVRGTQVLIATVYDGEGVPRRKRRVEWMLDGPGSIIEVDENSSLRDRGTKLDNKFAYSRTDSQEHRINKGEYDFTIGPGQSWCVVTSPVEGETTVTAYVPAIADWNKNRAYARLVWTDAGLEFPAPLAVRAGGEYTLGTKVAKASDGLRVRYRIIDGPPAALTSGRGAQVNSVTEAVAAVDTDGAARVAISQPLPVAGVNRIAIEVLKPSPDNPSQTTVMATGETKVTWEAPQLAVDVKAPKIVTPNQDVTVNYTVTDTGGIAAGGFTMTAHLPDGMSLVQTEPKAAVDGDELIWTLTSVQRGKPQSFRAIYRPNRIGEVTFTADAKAEDGTRGRGTTTVDVREAKLLLRLESPKTAIVGETLPIEITVTNAGAGPADRLRIQSRLADGLEASSKSLEQTIASLPAGQSKTVTLSVNVKRAGKHAIDTNAVADGNQVAIPQSTIVEVQDVQLGLTAHGPARGYIGEEVTWQIVVRNNGDVPLSKITARASLPPEVSFVKATDGGKISGRQVIWDLGTAPARQERTVAVTVICDKPIAKTLMTATASASPAADRDGVVIPVSRLKSISAEKPVETSLEIQGVPALQLSVKDSNDPVGIGQKTNYTIRVKNSGTLAATKIDVAAELPSQLRAVRATGPNSQGKVDGQRITFTTLPTLAPNAEATFVVEVEGLVPGDARFRVEARSAVLKQPLRAEEPTRVLGRESRIDDR